MLCTECFIVCSIHTSHLIQCMFLPYRWIYMWPTASCAYPSYEAFWWATSSLWTMWISVSDTSESFGSYALPYRGLYIQMSVFCRPVVILHVRHKQWQLNFFEKLYITCTSEWKLEYLGWFSDWLFARQLGFSSW